MQRPSTALSLSSSSSSYVLRSIVLPYLSSTSTFASSPVPVSPKHTTTRSVSTQISRCTVNKQSACNCLSGKRLGSNDFSAARAFSTGPILSFQQVRGHDPPATSPSRGSTSGESTAQDRTREYLGIRRNAGAFEAASRPKREKVRNAPYTPASHHAETSAMALQRILQAYTGRSTVETEGESGANMKKGKGKEMVKSVGRGSVAANGHHTAAVVDSADSKSMFSDTNHDPGSSQATSPQPATAKTKTCTPSPRNSVSYTSLSDYPPMISRLLKARLFRLTVFHLLSTPQYATNGALLLAVAGLIEEKGAGKLARRLRRGWEVHQENIRQSKEVGVMDLTETQLEVDDRATHSMESEVRGTETRGKRQGDVGQSASGGDKKLRLWSDPRRQDAQERLPVDHWNIPKTPPSSFPDSAGSAFGKPSPIDRQKVLTAHYNAHLHYLLTRPYLPPSSSLPTSTGIHLSKINDFPPPAPNLQQLRKLLTTIQNLEKRGFVPDRQTGNIILKCWLRCSAPASRLTSSSAQQEAAEVDALVNMDERSYRVYKDKVAGAENIVRKVGSEKGLTPKELRKMFEIISKLITSSYNFKEGLKSLGQLPATNRSTSILSAVSADIKTNTSQPSRSQSRSGSNAGAADIDIGEVLDIMERQEKEKITEYETVVKPFARMMIRSMRAMGDAKGVERVIGWLQEQRRLLVLEE